MKNLVISPRMMAQTLEYDSGGEFDDYREDNQVVETESVSEKEPVIPPPLTEKVKRGSSKVPDQTSERKMFIEEKCSPSAIHRNGHDQVNLAIRDRRKNRTDEFEEK